MKLPVLAGVLAALLTGATAAQASQVVVGFEDIGPDTGYQIPEGYGGISGWEEFGSLLRYSIYQSPYPELGGQYFGVHYGGAELRFDSGPVVFEGVDYQFVGYDSQVSFDLYYQDRLVYSAPLDPENQPDGIYRLASGYSGLVDKIFFHGTSDGVIIDNLTYSTASPVPLPGAVWLFGGGLAGALFNVYRRKVG